MSKGENIEVRGAAARLGWTMVAALLIVLLPAGGRPAAADEKGAREVIVLEIDCYEQQFEQYSAPGKIALEIEGFPWRGQGDDSYDACARDFDLFSNGQSGLCTADLDSIESIVAATNIRCEKGPRHKEGGDSGRFKEENQHYLCRETIPKLKKLVHRICKVIMKID
jgi:hypothetical protein